jgi:hypothetical protein
VTGDALRVAKRPAGGEGVGAGRVPERVRARIAVKGAGRCVQRRRVPILVRADWLDQMMHPPLSRRAWLQVE